RCHGRKRRGSFFGRNRRHLRGRHTNRYESWRWPNRTPRQGERSTLRRREAIVCETWEEPHFLCDLHTRTGRSARPCEFLLQKKGYASHACRVVSVTQQQSRKRISGSRIRTYAQLERECNTHFPQRFVEPHAKDASDTREITVQRANDSARFR